MNANFQLGLLYFVHLLIDADGVADKKELEALQTVKTREGIDGHTFRQFQELVRVKPASEIYNLGMACINQCSDAEKLHIFATLYRMSEVDGRVHTKEIRLLLNSLNDAGVAFDEVVYHTRHFPPVV